jgi:hypothetical protein
MLAMMDHSQELFAVILLQVEPEREIQRPGMDQDFPLRFRMSRLDIVVIVDQ